MPETTPFPTPHVGLRPNARLPGAGVQAWILIPSLLAACGGSSEVERAPSAELTRTSTPAMVYVAAARRSWAATMSADLGPEGLRQSLRENVVDNLDKARLNDGRWPLPASLKGDVLSLFDDEEAALREAESAYAQAYEIIPEWTPSWTGFCRLAIIRGATAFAAGDLAAARGRFETARHCADGAEWSVRSLASWENTPDERPTPSFTIPILNITITPPKKQRDPFDPRLSPSEARKSVMSWLRENLSWRLDNPALADGSGPGPVTDVLASLKATARHAQAEADHWLALVALESAHPSRNPEDHDRARREIDANYVAGLEAALGFDPDAFWVRIATGLHHYRTGDIDRAQAWLEPYALTPNPMLNQVDGLMVTVLRIYLHRYFAKPGPLTLEATAGFCRRLTELKLGFKPPVYRAAQEYFPARVRNDTGAMKKALETLSGAGPSAAGDEDFRQRLINEITDNLSVTRGGPR